MTTETTTHKPAETAGHSAEPWHNKHDSAEIYDAGGQVIANNPRVGSPDHVESGAKPLRRAVACVNACCNLADPAQALSAAREVLNDELYAVTLWAKVIREGDRHTIADIAQGMAISRGKIEYALKLLGAKL